MRHFDNLSLNNIKEIIDGVLYEEQWADIFGYENAYQVSSFGRVKSLERVVYKRGSNRVAYIQKPKIITQYGKIYRQVNLYKNSICDQRYVHILVASAFVYKPDGKYEVNHIYGDKFDNRWIRLEWVTRSENIIHSYKNLNRKYPVSPTGSKHPMSKPVLQYDLEGKLIKEWVNISAAKKSLYPHIGSISLCCNGKIKQSAGFIWKFKEVSNG